MTATQFLPSEPLQRFLENECLFTMIMSNFNTIGHRRIDLHVQMMNILPFDCTFLFGSVWTPFKPNSSI